ncbi:MAG: hypothetical protein CMK32_15345 [Porticoccaceae bacterium]|nr:hypothetical protein [Porticoccaceae bacterium]
MKTLIVTTLSATLSLSALAADAINPGSQPNDALSRHTQLFHELDTDNSQSLSTDEAREAGVSSDNFVILDADRNGTLELNEFLALAELNPQKDGTAPDNMPAPQ